MHITDSALVACVMHAHRYLSERKLPDKAIDLLDEACARLRMQQESKPEHIGDLEKKARRGRSWSDDSEARIIVYRRV